MASGIQYAGEYTLESVRLFASSGNIIPLNGLTVSISLFENIFSPTMSGTITLLDANSIVSNLPIIGQEFLSFKIKTASITEEGTSVIDFTKNPFSVYKIDQRIEGTNSELITLHFASPEMLRNLRTRVSKRYTNTIDNIAIDVIQNSRYINSKKDLFVEETVGVRKIISPNSNPFTFIQKLSSEAISKNNGSPFFLLKEEDEELRPLSLDETAHATVCFSRAWQTSAYGLSSYWVKPDQVKKGAPTGQSMAKGSFMIHGTRNFIKVSSLKLAVGIFKEGEDYLLTCGPPEPIKKKCLCYAIIEPGGSTISDVAKKIRAEFDKTDEKFKKIFLIDDYVRALPTGSSKVTQTG